MFDMQNSSLSELEALLSDLRVRFNSGDRTVETRLRAVAAKVEQLRAENPDTRPPVVSSGFQMIAKALTPLIRRRCCGR